MPGLQSRAPRCRGIGAPEARGRCDVRLEADQGTTMNISTARIRLASLVAALAAISSLGGTEAARTAPRDPGYARHFGDITMKDGVQLAYVAYLPRAKGTFPAVLQYEPYQSGGSTLGWPDNLWLKNGYAVVIASVRGTGCSQGVFHLFGRHEGPDGAAIIHWVGAPPWSDRRVGMIGVAYPGFTQILVAAQHPKLLRAITPSAIAANTYSQIVYPEESSTRRSSPGRACTASHWRRRWASSHASAEVTRNARATTRRIRPPRCSFTPVPIRFSVPGGRHARFWGTSARLTSRPSYRAPGTTT